MQTRKESNQLFCPNRRCERPVQYARLRPHYKDLGIIVVKERPLCCYKYTCPRCKFKSTFNADYVGEIWREEHQQLVTIKKL